MRAVKVVDTINEIAREEWDAITKNNVFTSYGWLQTAEATFIGDVTFKYILVRDTNKLIGATVCYVFNKTDLVINLDDLFFGRLKKHVAMLGISFMPGFVCGPLFGGGAHFLIEGEADSKKKEIIIIELLDTIEDIAMRYSLSPAFLRVVDDERQLIHALADRKYSKSVHVPLNYIDIQWGSFEEYRISLKKISRNIVRVIKRERNKNKKEGVTIRTLDHPERHENRLYELLNHNYYKYNQRPFMFRKDFFGKVKQALGEDAVFYVSLKEDVISGVCVLFRKNRVGYIPMVAVDHEMAGNDCTYFNILFYRPVMDAISNQTRRLYYGRGMYELKGRRGCVTKNLYIYYKSSNRLKNAAIKPWFTILSTWNKHKLPKRVRNNLRLARQTGLKN